MARAVGSNPTSPTNGYQSGTRLSETGGYGDNKIGIWEYRIAAIAGDCKSPLFGVQRFESSYSHPIVFRLFYPCVLFKNAKKG
jgi:hypothetical protein